MNQKIKNLVKGIIVIVVFAFVLIIVTRVLMTKSEDGIEQMWALYKQKPNTVDVVFLGSSKGYCMLDTGVVWDEQGISSFDTGGAEAPSWVCYYYMKELLKTQKPKVIMYETTVAAYRNEVMEQPEVWSVVNNYGFHWNRNRIESLKVNTTKENFYRLLLPLGSMHNNYKSLTKNDFVDENNTINHKGFDSRETVVEFDTPDAKSVTERVPCNEKHIIYLQKMIDLARENGIEFVVMVSPYYVTNDEQKIFNYLSDYCLDQGVEFINYNYLYDEMGLDFKTDMAENIHVNLSGSKKWSSYVGKQLKEKYELEDHRGDNKYYSWEVDALWNRQDRLRYDLENSTTISEITDIISSNSNYLTYISISPSFQNMNEEVQKGLNEIGVNNEMLIPCADILVNDMNTEYFSSQDVFDYFNDEGDIKLLFKRNSTGENSKLYVNESVYEFNNYYSVSIKVYDRVLKRIVLERDY